MNIEKELAAILMLPQNQGKTIHSILEKYWFQRRGEQPISGEPWAESDEEREHYAEHFKWESDGLPTGIADDKIFEALQKKVYGKVIDPVGWTILEDETETIGDQLSYRWHVIHSDCGDMKAPMIVIGINPSGGTKKSEEEGTRDTFSPTAKKLHKIAENAKPCRHSIILLNITPVVEKTVAGLLSRIDDVKDVRKANLDHIKRLMKKCHISKDTPVLLCFGNAYSKIAEDKTMRECLSEILEILPSDNIKCLGLTKKNNPRHPLYAPSTEMVDCPTFVIK